MPVSGVRPHHISTRTLEVGSTDAASLTGGGVKGEEACKRKWYPTCHLQEYHTTSKSYIHDILLVSA